MKDDFQAHNAEADGKIRKFLVPTLPEFLIYLLMSVLVLTLFNATLIWKYYRDNIVSLQAGDNLIGQSPSGLKHLVLDVSGSRVPLILFWLLVGCLAYIFIWFMHNIYLNIRNDFVADAYVHPYNYDRAHFWETVLIRKVIFAVSLVILAAYVPLVFRLLRILAQDAHVEVANFSLVNGLAGLLIIALVGSFLLYVLALLVHTVFRCWRIIYSDL
jgi:hypothetical protein